VLQNEQGAAMTPYQLTYDHYMSETRLWLDALPNADATERKQIVERLQWLKDAMERLQEDYTRTIEAL
jgi:hypothetical protein